MSRMILILLIGFVFAACSKSDNTDKIKPLQVNEKKVDSTIKLQDELPKNERTKDFNSAMINIDISGTVISSELLKDFLPANIAGTKKSKPSIGRILGETSDVTTASYNYSFNNGGIVFQISDYGSLKNIPEYEKKYFSDLPNQPGKETLTIVEEKGKGYILWDYEHNSGSMYYLLANRFIVKLEAYQLPPNSGDLVSFFNKINIDKLINKARRL